MTNRQLDLLEYLHIGDFTKAEPDIGEESQYLEDTGLIIWYDGYHITYDGETVYQLLREYL